MNPPSPTISTAGRPLPAAAPSASGRPGPIAAEAGRTDVRGRQDRQQPVAPDVGGNGRVPDDDRVVRGVAPDRVHDLAVVLADPGAGIAARRLGRRPGLLRVLLVGAHPADQPEQLLKAGPGVPDDGQGRRVVPADDRGVGVQVRQRAPKDSRQLRVLWPWKRVPAASTTSAPGDDVLDLRAGGQRTQGQRMVLGNGAAALDRGDGRGAAGARRAPRARVRHPTDHAAAGPEHRPGRGRERFGNLGQGVGVRGVSRSPFGGLVFLPGRGGTAGRPGSLPPPAEAGPRGCPRPRR